MVVARVRRTILERGLIEPGMRVLCACSGGPDSAALVVVLSRLASELGFELEAASVHHGLRPEAGRDVAIAREQALAVGVAFHPLRVEVAGGESVQAAAREVRYRALADLAGEIGAARIATGHTRDDQAETVLMRILRGAGLRGLAGVQARRKDGVVRPLIDCRRVEVAAFARASCPRVADDRSNRDPRFERVRVRRDLLPALEREDSAVVEHLAELAEEAGAAREALADLADALLPQDEDAETIDLSKLVAAPVAVLRVGLQRLLEARTGLAVGRSHVTELARALTHGGEVWLPGGWVGRCSGDGVLELSGSLADEAG
ncbi:MAG: tRNA lysidine(34) synthetase TilS [Myxococcales bacterium]|nr:tRNA lysidine(34) synthetase TilS [Myxococcales bacterium]